MLAAAFASCRKAPAPVRVGIHSAPLSFDPHLQNEVLTSAILANLYDGLTEFDQESRIRPALAAEWRNPDDRTWVFRLRPGVRFHDGRPLTAEDVIFSLERARTHSSTGFASYLVEVESLKALDPLTVEIRTRNPFAALLAKLSPIQIVPHDSPETITRPVGTGSYQLERYEEGKVVELLPSASDWRGGSKRAPLTFVVEREPRRRLERLLSGELDLAAGLSEDAVDVLRGSPGCRAELRPGSVVEYVHLAQTEPRFRDRRVREAIDLAIDRADFVARAHHGLGQPVGQLVAAGVFGYADDLKPPARDLARARRLLAEAGFPDGIDLTLYTSDVFGGLVDMAVAFKDGFAALLMPVMILGGILGGVTTPTEAAAIAVAYALLMGMVVYRTVGWADLYEMLVRTSRITGIVFLIIASASILGWWMTFNQIPQAIAAVFLSISETPAVVIALILTMLLLLGMFMDINAMLIILAPVLAPLTLTIGMDPVHAGVMIVLALNISLMTPPVGACLFVLASVTGEKIEKISRALWPFIIAEVAILFAVAYWPALTLSVPRLLGLGQ